MNENGENCLISLFGRFTVEYATSRDGEYSRYISVSLYRETPVSDFVSYIRRNLLGSPTWVRAHVPSEFVEWRVRFWFRFFVRSNGFVYFPIDISSSDLNSISSRKAAL